MKNLYQPKTANYPRLKTDICFADYENEYKYTELFHSVFRFVEDHQLLDPVLWKRFVEQFRIHCDNGRGWRGEYWGKMMRGACFVYSYTRNQELYDLMCQTVRDMASSIEEDGRLSTYLREQEFGGWDIWCRKYVLLGMQYFLEICEDDKLKDELIDNMCRQLDYIMSKVGPDSIPITKTTNYWRGLNSSSLLEPVVRLYSLTGKTEYLDYAKYIIDCGFTDVSNIINLVLEDDFPPYQYPITKAYEMISCFEGLLEYYRITGEETYRTAVIRFADRLLETDFTVIGGCGCTHEQFDHSTVRQANTTNHFVMQETCVTVTLMKFMYQLHLLTGESKYVDAFETSLYNAYFGAINSEQVIEPLISREHPDWIAEPLPFGSYSPLTAGTRGRQIGGLLVMPDNHYYGCCACIGSAGIGLVPKLQLVKTSEGFALNLFIGGTVKSTTPSGSEVTFETSTDYPKSGSICVTVTLAQEERFTLLVRNPSWSKTTSICVNGQKFEAAKGYICLDRVWRSGDTVELELDMRVFAIRPIPYGTQIIMNYKVPGVDYVTPTFDREDPLAHRHIALQRGPVMLAQDEQLGYSVDDPIDVLVNEDGTVDAKFPDQAKAPYPNILEMQIPLRNGTMQTVTDCGSAGKLWREDLKMAVWMLTE